MLLKSTISCYDGVVRKLSLVEIPILNHPTVGDHCKVLKIGSGVGAPTIMVRFKFKKEISGALVVYPIVHWCSQEVEVWRKSLLLSSNNLRIVVKTSGVWGEAPAANDFGAFFVLKKVFGAI